jgi:7-cyano-7-deazaguanine synthase
LATSIGAVDHKVIKVDLSTFGGSALTDLSTIVPAEGISPGIPVTYVPARNTIMLSLALAWAEVLRSSDVFIGVNAVDYSGYPDCRPEYIAAFEKMANLATKAAIEGATLSIQAPLISLSKAQIIEQGILLGLDYSLTVSCYQADEAGRACGICDSCRIRRAGFRAARVPDPTHYRSPFL